MATQQPLRLMIPAIMEHIKSLKNQTIFEQKLMDLYEGSLQKYVEESIRAEFEPSAAARAIQRIAPINVLPKIINKLSNAYTDGISRTADTNPIDAELLSAFNTSINLTSVMTTANKTLNLFKYAALEPYIYAGAPRIRVLPPTQFTVFSDDTINPLHPTVFIKYMGTIESTKPTTDQQGRQTQSASDKIDAINLYYLYSDTEFLVVDAEGVVRTDEMARIGNPEGINPLGVIPFVYLSQSQHSLIPLPNTDMYQMTILIPKLLTDLNYATKFQSHAIIYGIDVDVANLKGNPDSFWDIKSLEGGKTPSLGTIKPEVDVDKVLSLIQSTITIWLDSLGMSSAKTDSLTVGNAASGISKAIDEADATAIRRQQQEYFIGVERNLWSLLTVMQSQWAMSGLLTDGRSFSADFQPALQFIEPTVLPDPKLVIDVLMLKLNNGLTSYRRAVQTANPDLSSDEVDTLIAEIRQERLATMEEFQVEPEEEEGSGESLDQE